MPILIFFAILIMIAGGIFAFGRWDARAEARMEAEWREQTRRSCAETVAFFKAERDRENARTGELVKLSWVELRAWHERLTGQPCECPTKHAIAEHIYWHERRHAKGSS